MAVKASRKARKRTKGRMVRSPKSELAIRLRERIGSANGPAPFKVTAVIRVTRKILVFVFLVWSGLASATTYYVSSSVGSDSNNGDKPGAEKKDAAMSFLQNALAMTDAVAAREIINPDKFKDGISMIIDGTVKCLNASTWCKQSPTASSQPSA
jgi:hypothetical protein